MIRRALFRNVFSIAAWVVCFAGIAGVVCSACSRTPAGARARAENRAIISTMVVEGLDPAFFWDQGTYVLHGALSEGLFRPHPETNEPEPGVAERWEVRDGGKKIRFFLRADACWQDGSPVTAADFVRSFQRMVSPAVASPNAQHFFVLKNARALFEGKLKDPDLLGVRAHADRELDIELERPVAYVFSFLANPMTSPQPSARIQQAGSKAIPPEQWVSNGPFLLQKFKLNQDVTVVRNPKYWDAAHVGLSGITYRTGLDENADDKEYRTGGTHVSRTVPMSRISVEAQEHPREVVFGQTQSLYFLTFQTERGVFRDARVRRAFALAIDRSKIAAFLPTKPPQASSFVPPGIEGWKPTRAFRPDVRRAQALLAEAGFPDGKGLPRIRLGVNTQASNKMIIEVVQADLLKNLGVKAEVDSKDGAVLASEMKSGDFDIAVRIWYGDFDDATPFTDFFRAGSSQNRGRYKNAAYEKLVTTLDGQTDRATRLKAIAAIEKLLAEEAPGIPLYHIRRVFRRTPELLGWYGTPFDLHPAGGLRFVQN